VFAHVVFDTFGHSPLVRHYLERRGLLQTAGYSILVKRTEVEKLPPYLFSMHIYIKYKTEFLDYVLPLRHRLIKNFYMSQPKLAKLHKITLIGDEAIVLNVPN